MDGGNENSAINLRKVHSSIYLFYLLDIYLLDKISGNNKKTSFTKTMFFLPLELVKSAKSKSGNINKASKGSLLYLCVIKVEGNEKKGFKPKDFMCSSLTTASWDESMDVETFANFIRASLLAGNMFPQ